MDTIKADESNGKQCVASHSGDHPFGIERLAVCITIGLSGSHLAAYSTLEYLNKQLESSY